MKLQKNPKEAHCLRQVRLAIQIRAKEMAPYNKRKNYFVSVEADVPLWLYYTLCLEEAHSFVVLGTL